MGPAADFLREPLKESNILAFAPPRRIERRSLFNVDTWGEFDRCVRHELQNPFNKDYAITARSTDCIDTAGAARTARTFDAYGTR